MKYTLTVVSENKPGVLYRVVGIFVRKRLNIESLSVREVNKKAHLSRYTIILNCSADTARKVASQIDHIVEVLSVAIAR